MLTDPNFYAVAIPAVALVGLSKGGLGGALALIGVPLLAFAVPPMQAAAIFLPILLIMDAAALWAWRGFNSASTLRAMMPGALVGLGLGWGTSSYVSADAMRIVLGGISVIFAVRYFIDTWAARNSPEEPPAPERPIAGSFWGSLAGYGSFVAHAGGPPFQVYVLPLKLDPRTYTGASTRFFAILNVIKVVPYFAMGELDATNLSLSLALLPVALVSTLVGARIITKIRPTLFYPLMYAMVLIAGGKLLYDGMTGVFGS